MRGHTIELVVEHPRDAEELALAFPRTMVFSGDARDPDVLTQARVADADCLIAVTPDDATNLSVCLLAREAFGVGTVAGLATHPSHVRVFDALGIPCVSSNEIVVGEVLSTVGHHLGVRVV